MKSQKLNIVILHGWGSNPDRWAKVVEHLKEELPEANILIPSLPGFSPKNLPDNALTIHDYATWLGNYLVNEKVEKPVLIGHSHGGRTIIRFASNLEKTSIGHANKPHALILIGAAGLPPKKSLKTRLFKFLATSGKKGLAIIRLPKIETYLTFLMYSFIGEKDYYNAPPVMKETMKNVLSYNATNDLKNIHTPTLCIWGSKDTSTPLWMGKKISSTIKDARLEILEDEGHNIHRSQPKRLAHHIGQFIHSL